MGSFTCRSCCCLFCYFVTIRITTPHHPQTDPQPTACKSILYGDPDKLYSSYHVSYNMLLNMLRVQVSVLPSIHPSVRSVVRGGVNCLVGLVDWWID